MYLQSTRQSCATRACVTITGKCHGNHTKAGLRVSWQPHEGRIMSDMATKRKAGLLPSWQPHEGRIMSDMATKRKARVRVSWQPNKGRIMSVMATKRKAGLRVSWQPHEGRITSVMATNQSQDFQCHGNHRSGEVAKLTKSVCSSPPRQGERTAPLPPLTPTPLPGPSLTDVSKG